MIDNFSRRILSWKLAARLEPQTTCAVLSAAAAGVDLKTSPATVVADSGVENVNGEVDALLKLGHLRRVLAQVEVTFSNSMIEAWWRSLKHNWLFLNTLDTLAAVERLVAFYVDQHNTVMPHSAFHGQTPDEVYFATGAAVPNHLAAARCVAREARLKRNRTLHCEYPSDETRPARGPRAVTPNRMRRRREQWAELVERWRASGKTAREFAAQEQVNSRTLTHWGWQLRQKHGAPAGFIELTRPAAASEASAEAPTPTGCIEVLVRDSVRVRVSGAFDAELLRRVVAALEGR